MLREIYRFSLAPQRSGHSMRSVFRSRSDNILEIFMLFQSIVVPLKRVDYFRVLLQTGEYLAFFAGFWVFQSLEILDFSALTLCHFTPKEVLFYHSLFIFGH